jgi:electron transport complex protein RnfC
VALFGVRGGVKLSYRKELSSERPVVDMPLPARLYLPLQQHIGVPAVPVVTVGQQVLKGQLIAKAASGLSAPVHASSSGTVVAIADHVAPHPSGLQQQTIVIQTDGLERWAELPTPTHRRLSLSTTPRELNARVAAAGIVGMGGAAFPAAVKLDLKSRHQLDTLLINGAECEPYLTCDDRLMREEAAAVIDGVRIMAYALEVQTVIFAIERNKPQALAAIREAAQGGTLDPRAGPAHALSHGFRTPPGAGLHRARNTGTQAHRRHRRGGAQRGHGTCRGRTIRCGEPLVSRVVTVSGHGVREPANVRVPLGTPVQDLINFCGGLRPVPSRLIGGGPMMGTPLPSALVPVVKGTSGVLALTADEINDGAEAPCIRCGSCVSACPCGLVPVEMAQLVRRGDLQGAQAIGLQDCVSCGSCSFICPSHIPLSHFFSFAKGKLGALERDGRRQDRIRALIQARAARVERENEAKKAAAAARKAAKAAKEAAGAAGKAAAPVAPTAASPAPAP